MEIWKDIDGYEGLYQVSSFGRVKSLKQAGRRRNELILKGGSVRNYRVVHLSKGGKVRSHRVHRLVAEAFIPNPKELLEVNHKDEVGSNNRLENLEWCTRKYNANYGTATERRVKGFDYAEKVRNMDYKEKVKNTDYEAIGKMRRKPVVGTNIETGEKIYFEYMTLARKDGFQDSKISSVCRGDRKTHKGFTWRYLSADEAVKIVMEE